MALERWTKSQTLASYVYMGVRAAIVPRGIGGRRETVSRAHPKSLPSKGYDSQRFATFASLCTALDQPRGGGGIFGTAQLSHARHVRSSPALPTF
jgi:hypothetical protein